jgi:hypothetical protein
VLQDASNTLDQTQPENVVAFNLASGSGSLVASGAAGADGWASNIFGSLSGGPYNEVFGGLCMQALGGISGSPAFYLGPEGAAQSGGDLSPNNFEIDGTNTASSGATNTVSYLVSPSTTAPTSGPSSVTVTGPTMLVDFHLVATGAEGSGSATLTSNGTTSFYTSLTWGEADPFGTFLASFPEFAGAVIGFGIWGPLVPVEGYSQPSICCVC